MNCKRKTVWQAAVCSAIVLFMVSVAWSAPPTTISYQGFLTDSSGNPITSSVDMNVGFYNIVSGGTSIYTETHSGVTVSAGQFNILLGGGTSPSGAFPDFTDALWIAVTVAGQTMSPRIPMSAVPYARFAFSVADASITASKLNGASGNGTAGQVLSSNGTGGFSWADPASVTGPQGDTGATGPAGSYTIGSGIEDSSGTLSVSFGSTELLDLSGIDASTTTEGLRLPQAADVSSATAEGQISWDTDNDTLTVGTGTGVVTLGTGSGDMTKAVYDTGDNSKVDADKVDGIDGGVVNNSVIGGSAPAAGTFTVLTANAGAAVKNGASAGNIDIFEGSGDGTDKVTLQAQAMTGDYSLTLPVDAGASGQVLTTDGSGTLSWAAAGTAITGSATTIDTETLAVSSAMVTDGSGKVAVSSSVSATELNYLDGVSSAIQTQLTAKAPSASPVFTASMAIPNAAAPTTDAVGELALDTTITNLQPLLQYYDGGENMSVIAVDTSELAGIADDNIVKYDAATDKFVLEADAGGASNLVGLSDVGTSAATSGNMLIADGTDWESVAMSGDATIASTGAVTIAADAITLPKMASGTAGNVIAYDGSGNPVAVAAGTAGQVLTSNGAGAAPTFQATGGGASAAGAVWRTWDTTSDKVDVSCLAGEVPVAGGCRSPWGISVVMSMPFNQSGNTPVDALAADDSTMEGGGWRCLFATSESGHGAWVLCAPM
ncbi:hypothetical protein QUF90_22565 [Desulfococcaceae bacterium HSG9]|nr:hypothetical protein [Desulfococcaceae bacterium HSG9]